MSRSVSKWALMPNVLSRDRRKHVYQTSCQVCSEMNLLNQKTIFESSLGGKGKILPSGKRFPPPGRGTLEGESSKVKEQGRG